ncbi:MAG: hypothetical protein M3R08_00025, partial [Bacteroidota bacterium]|nr:hypothetical protein [Bacteroidota bacterium]
MDLALIGIGTGSTSQPVVDKYSIFSSMTDAPAKNFDRLMKTPIPPAFRQWLFLIMVLLSAHRGVGQRPAHYEHGNADMARARDLFSKEKYAAAQYEFQRVIDRIPDRTNMVRTEAEYYSALSAVNLFHDDAGHRLLSFISDHPEDPHASSVRFELFKYAFTQKKWKDVIEWSELVERDKLSAEEMEEYRFKRGYAYF